MVALVLVNAPNKRRQIPDQVSELTTNRLSIYLRCLTELEQAGVETISSQELAEQFHLNAAQIRKLADGRIYAGPQAKEVGLVDEIGYLDDAIALAKQQAGLAEARVVIYRRPGEYRPNIYARLLGGGGGLSSLATLDLMGLVRSGSPQFMYLWMP